jgi:hypothetical protein
MNMKNEGTTQNQESVTIAVKMELFSMRRECPICGEDDWCGTDGCPMDPQ